MLLLPFRAFQISCRFAPRTLFRPVRTFVRHVSQSRAELAVWPCCSLCFLQIDLSRETSREADNLGASEATSANTFGSPILFAITK